MAKLEAEIDKLKYSAKESDSYFKRSQDQALKEKDKYFSGVFARQKARADEYNVAVDRAYTRWSGNLAQVQLLEQERAAG